MVDTLFYLFSALTLLSALLVVVNRKPVNSVVSMILTIVGAAATLFLLDAPFLATLLIMVYAGAVIVLFLFVIMLMDPDVPALKRGWLGTAIGGTVFFALCAAGTVWLFGFSGAVPAELTAAENVPAAIAYSNEATAFGWPLFTKYVVLVEASALLLLAAMVAVFMLHSKRTKPSAGECSCCCKNK